MVNARKFYLFPMMTSGIFYTWEEGEEGKKLKLCSTDTCLHVIASTAAGLASWVNFLYCGSWGGSSENELGREQGFRV